MALCLPLNLCPYASVLDCGDGVFGVAALDRSGRLGGELWTLDHCQSQSGDSADSVTAVQNLAVLRRFMETESATNSSCGFVTKNAAPGNP